MTARERLLVGAVGLSLIARALLAAHHAGDFDEFQALHGAWNVTQGLLPYRDFWENHGPATYYLLAPIFLGGREGEAVFFAGRAIAALCGVGALALTLRIARLFVGQAAAWAAVAMLAWTPIFAVKTIETRPDAFFLLLWLGAVLVDLGGSSGRRAVLAGALVGCGLWLTPKALFGLLALVLGALAAGVATRELRRGLRHAALLGVGFLGPLVLLALTFRALGALDALWRWMIVFNFTVPSLLPRPLPDVLSVSAVALEALAVLGLWRGLRSGDGPRVALATATAVLVVIYVFVMPAPYPQSALPALPLCAVLAATLLEGRGARRVIWIAVLGGAVALPIVSLAANPRAWAGRARLRAQLDLGAYVRGRLAPDEAYFGPTAYPITRRSLWFFNVIPGEVAEALARGIYPPPDLPTPVDALRRAGCPMVVSGVNFMRARTAELAGLLRRRYRVVYDVEVEDEAVRYRVWVAEGGCTGD